MDSRQLHTRDFRQASESVPAARRWVCGLLGHLPDDLTTTAGLLVSELATNAVRYGGGPFEVSVLPGARGARVNVTDHGDGEPRVQTPSDTSEHGRGLQLVQVLAVAWGIERDSAGKTIWFELVVG